MFTLRNPLGYLGFFALLGAVGLFYDRSYLGFFGFLFYFRYFWVLPDEMFLDYTRRAASWGFFAGMGTTLAVTISTAFFAGPARAFTFGMAGGFAASVIVFSLLLTYYEFRENAVGPC